jgi:phage-related protein
VVAIAALVAAFIYAWKNSETFREVFTNVFNSVAQVVGTALSFILTGLGNLLIAFGTTMSPATSFGQTNDCCIPVHLYSHTHLHNRSNQNSYHVA